MRKIIEPTVDFCAKEIFENEVVRRYFLSAFLALPIEEIVATQIMNPYLLRHNRQDKEGILDILISLQDGRKVNIEIQVEAQKYWDKRSIYYLSKLYTQGFHRGQDYQELQKCVMICMLDFNYLPTVESHTVFRLRDKMGQDYTDVLELHIVELRKLQDEKTEFVSREKRLRLEQTYDNGDNSCEDSNQEENEYERAVQEWIRFFKCQSEEDAEMLKQQTKNPGIIEAIKELMDINRKPRYWSKHEMRMRAIRDRNARDAYVRDQGIEQGEDKFALLTQKLLADNRTQELKESLTDKVLREKLFKEYKLK